MNQPNKPLFTYLYGSFVKHSIKYQIAGVSLELAQFFPQHRALLCRGLVPLARKIPLMGPSVMWSS